MLKKLSWDSKSGFDGSYNNLLGRPLDDNFSTLSQIYNALGEDELLIYQPSISTYKKNN